MRFLAPVVFLLLVLPGTLGAQTVAGRVVDRDGGAPLDGAVNNPWTPVPPRRRLTLRADVVVYGAGPVRPPGPDPVMPHPSGGSR